MLTSNDSSSYDEPRQSDEQAWYDLFTWLLPLVQTWVYNSGVPSWYGQHKEIAEDIAQEAVMRIFVYNQRAVQGEVPPIVSLKALGRVVARNYFLDRQRKDRPLVRPTLNTRTYETYALTHEFPDPSQIALDHLELAAVIVKAAQAVAKFPYRQKMAILTDLANASDFDEQPSPLEQALSAEGLQLRDYRRPHPADPKERSRHAALRCTAYKRLRNKMRS
jgi:DNA-directed RNA polymerase specialized sigma24 family protein